MTDIAEQFRMAHEQVTLDPAARDACFKQCYKDGLFGATAENDARNQFNQDICGNRTAFRYIAHYLPLARKARHNQTHFERAVQVGAVGLAALIGMYALDTKIDTEWLVKNVGGAALIVAGLGVAAYGLTRRS
ncbi:MAG TPA: hypothetical protein VI612_02190 [Candidatus Nanoarchaeia archaeon]|nr:hypothetical protein [Candidatus Nanoarchaeia archaeon]